MDDDDLGNADGSNIDINFAAINLTRNVESIRRNIGEMATNMVTMKRSMGLMERK